MVLRQGAVVLRRVLRLLRQGAVVLRQVLRLLRQGAVVLRQVGPSSSAQLRQLASQRTSAVSTCTLSYS